jgi:ribosomal-protein-serine acetyltransferase
MIEWPEPAAVLRQGTVTLRRWREDDLDAVFQAVTECVDHLRPWMPWAADYTRDSAAEFLAKSAKDWADGNEYNYAIITDDVLVGGCGLMGRIGPGGLEIGYRVHNVASGGVPRILGFTEVGQRPLDPPPPAGTGVGVVWRLLRDGT